MGRRVVQHAGPKPPKRRTSICTECGAMKRVINGSWLRAVRQASGLDQRTLAARLGISGPYLSDIETNRRECPLLVLEAYEALTRKKSSQRRLPARQ